MCCENELAQLEAVAQLEMLMFAYLWTVSFGSKSPTLINAQENQQGIQKYLVRMCPQPTSTKKTKKKKMQSQNTDSSKRHKTAAKPSVENHFYRLK